MIPDLIRAFERGGTDDLLARRGQAVAARAGGAVRLYGARRAPPRGRRSFTEAWNFGPLDDNVPPVGWIVDRMRAVWGGDAAVASQWTGASPHEAGLLRLDSSKARARLGLHPALPLSDALAWIVDWHEQVGAGADAQAISLAQIERYQSPVGKHS